MNQNTHEPDKDPRVNPLPDSADGSAHTDVLAAGESSTEPQPGEVAPAVRVGSPFAVDPLESPPKRVIEPFYDVGPIRYTAMGAVAASIMVLFFAVIATWWFPSGGALIAALGCVLSIFGMYSAFRITSVSLLTLHLALFVLSYGRSIG